MILKTAANYNDEGGYIEAWKNSDGTTEVKLIPKSGGDEGGQGLKSISISPSITTTPALDSVFPIYWDDLTDEEKKGRKTVSVNSTLTPGDKYTATFTPSPDWYVSPDLGETWGAQGESVEIESMVVEDGGNNVLMFNTTVSSDSSGDGDYFEFTIYIVKLK